MLFTVQSSQKGGVPTTRFPSRSPLPIRSLQLFTGEPTMMIQGVSINEMISQSMTVLTKPSVQSFEQFEKRGGQREALIYVIIAAVLVGVVGLALGFVGGIVGAVAGLLRGVLALLGFYVFAFVLNYVGKQQGGTGTQ